MRSGLVTPDDRIASWGGYTAEQVRTQRRLMEAGVEIITAHGMTVGAPKTLKRIGDCDAPAIIAAAVFAGHRYARELDEEIDADNPLKYDRVFFEDGGGLA